MTYLKINTMNTKLLLLISLFLTTATRIAADNDPFGFNHLADSLERRIDQTTGEEKFQTIYRLYRVYSMTRENSELFDLGSRAVSLADSIGVPKLRMEARLMMLSYYNNLAQPDTFLTKVPPMAALAEELGEWDTYFILYDKIATWTRMAKGNDAVIEVTDHIYRKAKELNNHIGLGSALKLTGQTCIFQRRLDDAKKHLTEAIAEFDKVDVLPLKFEPYIFYALMPGRDKTSADRLEMLRLFEKDLATLDKKMALRQTLPEYSLRFYLNRMYCEYYLESKDFDKAEAYYRRLMTEPSIKSPMNGELIYQLGINLYTRMNQIDKALALNDSLEKAGIAVNYYDKLIRNLDLYRATKDAENMYKTFNRIVAYNDSTQRIEINAQLDELRTRLEVDRLTLEKEHQRTYTRVAVVGCLLLLLVVAIVVRYNRKLQAKNLSLYRQIQERNRSDRQAEHAAAQQHPQEEGLSSEEKLFRKLSQWMKTERPFTDPQLDRRKLADQLGTNEKYLADAIRQGSGETPLGYITKQRLNYALNLLDSQTDLSLEAVAIDSGHASYSTFFRAFTKTYGMNPSEYRRLASRNP